MWNKMRLLSLLLLISLLLGCADFENVETVDVDTQFLQDIELINNYISDNGLPTPDTTESGGRYIILEVGTGDSLRFGDIIQYEFIGYRLDSVVFFTNVQAVADTAEIYEAFRENNLAETRPSYLTHTESGWSLAGIDIVAPNRGNALREVIVQSFQKIKEGGKVLIFIPSTQGYGARGLAGEPYAVSVYELVAVQVAL